MFFVANTKRRLDKMWDSRLDDILFKCRYSRGGKLLILYLFYQSLFLFCRVFLFLLLCNLITFKGLAVEGLNVITVLNVIKS